MVSLTTTQRDLLRRLLVAEQPLSAAALGAQLHLTPRQVQYGLREIKPWLSWRKLSLRHTPGVGVQLLGDEDQKRALLAELGGQARLQLILTADQRQQLLALRLLGTVEPAILGQFQQELAVSRATVLKDLEVVEAWLAPFGVRVARRQHRGFWAEGAELARRQALAAIVWGALPCERPLLAVAHGPAIVFALARDVALLPIVAAVNGLLQAMPIGTAHAALVEAEAELGGQFAEEALPWLALAIAIQSQRIAAGRHVCAGADLGSWTPPQRVIAVAEQLAARLWPPLAQPFQAAELAAVAAQLCAAPREEPWPADLAHDAPMDALIAALQQRIARHYALPQLAHDELLRAGLEAHLPPAYVRQHLGLWAPPPAVEGQPGQSTAERTLMAELTAVSEAVLGQPLPPGAEIELLLLLRAALVRVQPERARRVLVVCPSGMATTQLLVARLRARLPRLGTYEVLPMRSLTAERVRDADLIISTVPLPAQATLPVAVVQVHPTLRPEDIAALMQWLP